MLMRNVDPAVNLVQVRTDSERAVLESFLDFHRGVALRKLRGLSETDAARHLVPSTTTVAGLVKHLTLVERNWFSALLDPRDGEVVLATAESALASFTLTDEDTVERLATAYEAECARSRAVAARYDLDYVVPQPQLGEVSLRWILVHMIQETARHAGHADILRELTDGSTGAF